MPAKLDFTDEQFVEAYLSSNSPSEVAKKLGCSAFSVGRIARTLRKAGVKLPEFRSVQKREAPDVDALNKLIEEKRKGA